MEQKQNFMEDVFEELRMAQGLRKYPIVARYKKIIQKMVPWEEEIRHSIDFHRLDCLIDLTQLSYVCELNDELKKFFIRLYDELDWSWVYKFSRSAGKAKAMEEYIRQTAKSFKKTISIK